MYIRLLTRVLVFVDCFCRISLILQLLIITHRGDEVRLIILMCGQTKDGLPNSFKYVAFQGCLVGVVVLPPLSLTGLLMTVTVTLCPSQLLFTYSSQRKFRPRRSDVGAHLSCCPSRPPSRSRSSVHPHCPCPVGCREGDSSGRSPGSMCRRDTRRTGGGGCRCSKRTGTSEPRAVPMGS